MRAILFELALIAFSVASLVPTVAQATPADVLVLVDSSGSMRKSQGTGSRLDAAKKLATEVIQAVQTKHRVGLARFAQLETVVKGGEGKRVAHLEDQKQCEHASNLLAPLETGGADQALRFLDGVEELGNPEVVALGDSPLARAVEVAVGYLRNKRVSDPLRHCVNAYLVVITDGEDTCATGDETRSRLATLAEQAQREDIHALVLSYTPDAVAASAVAKIGQADTSKPFGPDEGSKLLDAVRAIQGRLAPEACLASGVKPSQIGVGGEPDSGVNPDQCASTGGEGCSCAVTARPGGRGMAVVLLLGLALGAIAVARRRWRVLVGGAGVVAGALALTGCGDDAGQTCAPRDGGAEASGPPAGKLVEPTVARDQLLARLPTLLAAAEEVRTSVLAPMLSPEKAFAAVKDADGCATLARSLGFEPYRAAQRGPAGCLATRRCNSFDKALLLQACLKSKGVTAELGICAPDVAFRAKLKAEAEKPVALPDLAEVTAKEKELVKKLFPSEANAQAQLEALLRARDEGVGKYFAETVAKEVSTLEPLAGLDAGATAEGVSTAIDEALGEHYVVTAHGETIDPVIKGSDAETGTCAVSPVEIDRGTLQMKVQVLIQYAGPSQPNWLGDEHVAAERTLSPHELFGETLSVGIADAALTQLPAGLPPVSSTGCLRAFIEVGSERQRGEPFQIGEADAAACPGAPIVPAAEGEHLYRVALRITSQYGEVGKSFIVERTLVNRYGYALDHNGAASSGPMYSNETARQLLPLRIDLPVISGLLTPAALLDIRLRDLAGRKAEIEAALAEQAGLPVPPVPAGPPAVMPYAVIGTVVRYSPPLLGAGLTLVAERPWLVSHVQRRGFGQSGAALDVVTQTILDVMDAPLLVIGSAGAPARLKAQIGIGALVTEAEAAAIATRERVPVTNAGGMLRDSKLAGKWSLMDPQALDPDVFPLSVREAAARYTGEALIVTTGVTSEDSEPQIAWWRFDKTTGRTLSELRFDGTFYGGAAGVKLIIDIDKCLYMAASAALAGAETCDVNPCIQKAWKDYAKNVVSDYAQGALFALSGALGLGEGALAGFAELGAEMFGNISDIIEAASLPKCK